jgi:hypothetical protein
LKNTAPHELTGLGFDYDYKRSIASWAGDDNYIFAYSTLKGEKTIKICNFSSD